MGLLNSKVATRDEERGYTLYAGQINHIVIISPPNWTMSIRVFIIVVHGTHKTAPMLLYATTRSVVNSVNIPVVEVAKRTN